MLFKMMLHFDHISIKWNEKEPRPGRSLGRGKKKL